MAQTNVQAFSGDVAISSNLAVDTNTLFVDSVGNKVGIGTTTGLLGKLDVAGTLRVGTDTDGLINIGRSGTGGTYRRGYLHHDGTNMQLLNQEDGLLKLGTNNGTKMSILANGDVAISSNLAVDTNTLFVDSVGNKVGIGTTNPRRLLDVSDSTGETAMHISGLAGQSNVFIYMTEGPTPNHGAVLHYSGTGTPQGFRVGHLENSTTPRYDLAIDRASGNVGIGTVSPGSTLDVNGSTRSGYDTNTTSYFGRSAIGYVGHSDWAGFAHLDMNNANDYALLQNSGGVTYLNCKSDQYMNFRSGNNDKMRMLANGNFGIGTTNPQGQLHISSGTSGDCVLILQADTDNNNESDNPRIEFRQDGALIESVIAQGNNDLQLKNGIEGITFWTGGTEVGGDHVINTIQRMFINNDGNVGIGTASPVGKLHIVHGADGGATKDLDDQTNCAITSQRDDGDNRWMHGINGTNDYLFWYDADGSGIATCKAFFDENGSNSVDQNFTGQHRTFIKDVPFSQAGDLEGLVVSADQNKYIKMSGGIEAGSNAITTNESLPVVSLSTTTNDKKCFGVISVSEDPETRQNRLGNVVSVSQKEKGDTRVFINSVGEGAIWVTNINGSLESGDYITTSNVAGYGQKQDSEFLANYTVAKITMDCDFEPVTQPIQQIKKELEDVNYWVKTTYENVSEEEYSNLADESRRIVDDIYQEINKEESKTEQEGYELEVRQELVNVLDEHGQIQWEDDPSGATEKAYKIRYLDADGVETDEANAVHKAAFVGCTYHCG